MRDQTDEFAIIPDDLRLAIERHVAPICREEFLLDVADALYLLTQRGDRARIDEYVRECVVSLSMDRGQFDLL